MIKLMDKYTIIKLFQKGESFRGISKLVGIDRKTVAKYCKEYEVELEKLDNVENDPKDIQECILAKPKYNSSNRKSYKYNDKIDTLLDEILESEIVKDKYLGSTHKQSLSNVQIYKKIVAGGHDIGKTTICKKIREKRTFIKECFIRQDYELGDRLEYDFGEVLLVIKNERKKFHMAVLSSPSSDFRWAYLYKSQKKEVFLDSHVQFFEMTGGVHREIVYDNMRNVVSKFLGKNQKQLNEDLLNLSLYYGFDINVTNAFSGNEKGHVEGSVKIIRREIFGPKYEFNSYEDAKDYLTHELFILNENSEFEIEKEHLLPYKPKLELAEIRIVTINKYSFARINKNSYSVPDYLVGKKLTAKLYHDKIKFYSNNHFVCEHKKIDGSNETSIDIRHYLRTFKRKPGAIKNSLALKSLPRLKSIYDIHFKSNPKKFIELLEKYQELDYEIIIKRLKNYNFQTNDITNNDEIAMITENQLNLYNQLLIGRRH